MVKNVITGWNEWINEWLWLDKCIWEAKLAINSIYYYSALMDWKLPDILFRNVYKMLILKANRDLTLVRTFNGCIQLSNKFDYANGVSRHIHSCQFFLNKIRIRCRKWGYHVPPLRTIKLIKSVTMVFRLTVIFVRSQP